MEHDQTWKQYRQGQGRGGGGAQQVRPEHPVPAEVTARGLRLVHEALVKAGLRAGSLDSSESSANVPAERGPDAA